MSVSIYFTGRNQKPTVVNIDQAQTGLMDILTRECPDISTANLRYYVDLQQRQLEDLTLRELRGKSLVILGGDLRALSHDEVVKPITLYLRQPDGKTLKTHMRPIDSVAKAKSILADKFGVSADQWQILHKGNELNNDFELLLEHRISNNNIVHTIQKALQNGNEIEVVYSNHKLRTKVHLEPTKSIGDLKLQLEKVTGLAAADQMLIYCGGELADERDAASYHLSKDAQIFLVDKREKGSESRAQWFRESKKVESGEAQQKIGQTSVNSIQKQNLVESASKEHSQGTTDLSSSSPSIDIKNIQASTGCQAPLVTAPFSEGQQAQQGSNVAQSGVQNASVGQSQTQVIQSSETGKVIVSGGESTGYQEKIEKCQVSAPIGNIQKVEEGQANQEGQAGQLAGEANQQNVGQISKPAENVTFQKCSNYPAPGDANSQDGQQQVDNAGQAQQQFEKCSGYPAPGVDNAQGSNVQKIGQAAEQQFEKCSGYPAPVIENADNAGQVSEQKIEKCEGSPALIESVQTVQQGGQASQQGGHSGQQMEGLNLVQEGEQINAEKCMVSAPAVEKVQEEDLPPRVELQLEICSGPTAPVAQNIEGAAQSEAEHQYSSSAPVNIEGGQQVDNTGQSGESKLNFPAIVIENSQGVQQVSSVGGSVSIDGGAVNPSQVCHAELSKDSHGDNLAEGGEDSHHQSSSSKVCSTSTIQAVSCEAIEAPPVYTGEPFRLMITRGNGLIFAEEVVPDDTIQSLKVRVESAKGFPIPMQVFRHGDNVVEDHKTVRQMGWVHDAMVELTFVE